MLPCYYNISNYRQRSLYGFRMSTLIGWVGGDSFKWASGWYPGEYSNFLRLGPSTSLWSIIRSNSRSALYSSYLLISVRNLVFILSPSLTYVRCSYCLTALHVWRRASLFCSSGRGRRSGTGTGAGRGLVICRYGSLSCNSTNLDVYEPR